MQPLIIQAVMQPVNAGVSPLFKYYFLGTPEIGSLTRPLKKPGLMDAFNEIQDAQGKQADEVKEEQEKTTIVTKQEKKKSKKAKKDD